MSKVSLTIWRCSDNAKHADFGIRTRKPNIFRHQNDATGKICPNGKRSGFRYRVAKKFVDDICAAAKGYEYLAEAQMKAEDKV